MRTSASAPRVGDFEFDLESGELRKNGQTVRLSEQPFLILRLLVERSGGVVSREEIREKLWPADTFVDFDAGLNSVVRKLRDAFGDSAENPKYIETLPRRGYRLIAPIVDVGEGKQDWGMRPPWLWVGAAAVIVITAVALLLARGRMPAPKHTFVPARVESIAVLPLENLSGDPRQEYFADGMTDALITDLAQIRNLRVISRTSTMQYKRARKTLPEIARELKVDAVVEGTVVRSGRRVRITAQLIHAATDQHLWARSYERDLGDILPLQNDLAQAIAQAVKIELAPHERARLQTARRVDPDAYEAFLHGLMAASPQSYPAWQSAIRHFEEAVAKQPDFAIGHAAMSRSYYQFAFVGPLAPQDFMPKAEAAARRALELDDTLAEAHLSLANVLYRYHWDWTVSEEQFRRAVELKPSDAETHRAYSEFLGARGRSAEAKAESDRARSFDPLAGASKLFSHSQKQPRAHYQRGWKLVLDGDLTHGIAELEEAVQLSDRNPRFVAALGYAYGAGGKKDKARKILEELKMRSRGQYVSAVGMTLIHVSLGEKQAALQRLEQAYQEHAFELANLKTSHAFDPLRSDPHFQDLLRRVGFISSTSMADAHR